MKKKPLIEVTKSHEKMEQPPRKKYNLKYNLKMKIFRPPQSFQISTPPPPPPP